MKKILIAGAGGYVGQNLIGIGRRPDDGTRYRAEWFDISNLTAETGFEPRIPFEEGVRENIDFVRREILS